MLQLGRCPIKRNSVLILRVGDIGASGNQRPRYGGCELLPIIQGCARL